MVVFWSITEAAPATFATDVLEATDNVAAVMTVLGHSKVQMTIRYQNPQLNSLREAKEAKRSEQTDSSNRAHRELVQ